MGQEIAFERALAALETTRGTAVDPPTRYLNLALMITPQEEVYVPEETAGLLAATLRSATMRRSVEFEGEGGADTRELHFWAAMAVKGAPVMTTPVGGTNTRLWTAARTMTSDDLKAATFYWGDPNVEEWQTPFCMVQELTITADASGTDGVQMSVNGIGNFWSQVSPSDVPARSVGPIIAPGEMQLWLDTSSAIGTTAITGRVVSAELTIPTGVVAKYIATGPGASLTYSKVGREKTSPECVVVMELEDTAQYNIYAGSNGNTIVKMRVRLNGPIIEGSLRHYIQWDIWGPLRSFGWGDLEGTNRTLEFTITGHYDTTAGTDLILYVQNDQTSL